jgi:hypothetical protein
MPLPAIFEMVLPKNKNAGLVGPAASLLLICGERLVYVSCPRGSFKLLGPHRYGPLFSARLLDQSQTFELFFQNRKRAP